MIKIIFNMLGQNEKRLAKFKGPRELPQELRDYLLNKRAMHPKVVDKLLCVVQPTETKHQYSFRIFDPDRVAANGKHVSEFRSLDNNVDLVLFEGEFNIKTNVVNCRFSKHLQRQDFKQFFGQFFT